MDFIEQIFKKLSKVRFYENSSIASLVVSCGQMDG